MTRTDRICQLAREAAAKCREAAKEFDKADSAVERYDFNWMASALVRAADRLERAKREREQRVAREVADTLAAELV